MKAAKKGFLLLLLLFLAASNSLFIQTAFAQVKPSIPEFTVETRVQANETTITLTIKNQPFDAASQSPNGFFYNVAISVDGKNWSELYHVEDAEDWYPQQSNFSTTVLIYVAGETIYYPRDTSQGVGVIPKSGEVAFQVQAMIGHRDRGAFKNGFMPYVFVGETSDWSNTQSDFIGEDSSLTPTPAVTANQQGTQSDTLSWIIIAVFALAVLVTATVIFQRRRRIK
jgi:hypothetical protein